MGFGPGFSRFPSLEGKVVVSVSVSERFVSGTCAFWDLRSCHCQVL